MLTNKSKLDLIKKEVLLDLEKLVKKIDTKNLSKFNRDYLKYQKDPYKKFVLGELDCWNKIIDFYAFQRGNNCKGILDIGTFIPYYPTILKKIGYKIEVVEKISLYGKAYDPILEYLNSQDIKVHNIDIVKEHLDSLPKGYDILLIAVLEHLNGSPRELINKIKSLMDQNSSLLYIHVPNICKLSNVISTIRGKSPLPLYENYFFSGYPFTGHNREMTLGELLSLCRLSSLKVIKKGRIIKRASVPLIKGTILNTIKRIMPKYSDSIYVLTKKKITDVCRT